MNREMEDAIPDRDLPSPLLVTALYLLFGVAWIVLSDWAVTTAFGVSALTIRAQLAKGLLFVAGSGAFIYLLVVRRDRLIRRRETLVRSGRSTISELESEVARSERMLQVVLSNITETVLLTDDSGAFTYVCDNVHFIFGYSAEAVEELGTVDALLGDDPAADGVAEDEVLENLERRIVDADGEAHTVLVSVKAVSIDAGSRLYSIRDISERKAQEERFEAYLEHSSDVLTVIDESGTIEYVSPSIERVLGYEPDTVLGGNAFDLINPRDREAVWQAFEALKAEPADTTRSAQYRTRYGDDSWRWVESRLTASGSADVGGYVVNTHDITDLKEREGRISVLDRVLRHNLRNKLNLILGRARQLDTGDDPAAAEAVAEILDAGERLLSMSEKARRFDASVRPTDGLLETVELAECVRDVVKTARNEHPQATLRTDCPAEVTVSAHEAFELAVAELIDNAVDHADEGDPTVEIAVAVEEDSVTVTVADDGPGISSVERRVLLEGEETPLEHGLGLGLWLVRWTVINSGGSLDVRENEPRGTVVEVTLPRVEEVAGGQGR